MSLNPQSLYDAFRRMLVAQGGTSADLKALRDWLDSLPTEAATPTQLQAVSKPQPRVIGGSTGTLLASDTIAGVVCTANCALTVDTAANLGDGFVAAVVADGGTITFSGLSGALSCPSGQSVVVEVRNGKRWAYGPSSPAVTPS